MKQTQKHGVWERITWPVCEINIHKDSNSLFIKRTQLPSPIYIPRETLCLLPT